MFGGFDYCAGSQGWGNANNPVLNPVVYDPYAAFGLRFAPWAPTTIPRMYHSTANLLDVSPSIPISLRFLDTHAHFLESYP